MSIDLRLMRYVIAVADTGGFERAAAQLHMAQPPLSRQIAALERELGIALFLRRPTRLTPAGRVFVAAARETLQAAERTVALTRQAARRAEGTVRLGYGPTTASTETPLLIAAMADAHPLVRVQARELWDTELTASLRSGETDAALGRHLAAPDGCTVLPLRREDYVAAVHPRHRLAHRREIALRELRGESLRVFARDLAPDYYEAVLVAAGSTGESFPVWENPVPGLRNDFGVHDSGFMLLPRSVAASLPEVSVLSLSDDLPAVTLELVLAETAERPATPSVPSPLAALAATARAVAADQGWSAG
ncbi:LysR family transcriptional regulator [Streptomyces sp. 4N509B]|uniref:LysR family transcriptional regulator n=1 Tax=Streptomyces sp. 4N509B TaxID=3457413 RepID=UPI003FD1CF02